MLYPISTPFCIPLLCRQPHVDRVGLQNRTKTRVQMTGKMPKKKRKKIGLKKLIAGKSNKTWKD